MSKNDDINKFNIDGVFYSALYGDKGQKLIIGDIKIWMNLSNDILNYKIIAPSEINEGILRILLALSSEKDITLNEIKAKEKTSTVNKYDASKILDYFYTFIESLDFEPVDYLKSIIAQMDGEFDVNTAKRGDDSPLVHALKNVNTLEMIQCLVDEFGCNVNILDQDGHSPLYHAYNMEKSERFKTKIIEYLIEVGASLTLVEQTKLIELTQSTNRNDHILGNDHILALERLHVNDDKLTVKETFTSCLDTHTKQVALDIEAERLKEEKKILENLARTSIDKAIKGEKDIQFEDTNFIINKKENGKLDVLYNLDSEVFTSLSKIANKQEVKLEFVYDKHSNSNIEQFTGNSYKDLITQVLKSDKGMFSPQIDLILQKNESNIECFCGQKTFEKLKILYDITVQMGLDPTFEELRYNDVKPEEIGLAGEMDLPD